MWSGFDEQDCVVEWTRERVVLQLQKSDFWSLLFVNLGKIKALLSRDSKE